MAHSIDWTVTAGFIDPDGFFLATLKDDDGEELDSEGLNFAGDTDAFESDQPWHDAENRLLERNHLDRGEVEINEL